MKKDSQLQEGRVSLQGYIYEDDLKQAVSHLRRLYKDAELVREGVRCLARREGLLSTEKKNGPAPIEVAAS